MPVFPTLEKINAHLEQGGALHGLDKERTQEIVKDAMVLDAQNASVSDTNRVTLSERDLNLYETKNPNPTDPKTLRILDGLRRGLKKDAFSRTPRSANRSTQRSNGAEVANARELEALKRVFIISDSSEPRSTNLSRSKDGPFALWSEEDYHLVKTALTSHSGDGSVPLERVNKAINALPLPGRVRVEALLNRMRAGHLNARSEDAGARQDTQAVDGNAVSVDPHTLLVDGLDDYYDYLADKVGEITNVPELNAFLSRVPEAYRSRVQELLSKVDEEQKAKALVAFKDRLIKSLIKPKLPEFSANAVAATQLDQDVTIKITQEFNGLIGANVELNDNVATAASIQLGAGNVTIDDGLSKYVKPSTDHLSVTLNQNYVIELHQKMNALVGANVANHKNIATAANVEGRLNVISSLVAPSVGLLSSVDRATNYLESWIENSD